MPIHYRQVPTLRYLASVQAAILLIEVVNYG